MNLGLRSLVWLISIGGMLWSPPHGRAQKPADNAAPTVIFGTVAGERGSIIGIPVYFKTGKSKVKSISLAVDFISNSVKFDRSDASAGVSGRIMTLSVQPEELPPSVNNLPRTRLKIAASIHDSVTSNTLPEGLWTFLNFNVSPDAKPFAVSLQSNLVAAQDQSNKPVAVSIEPGKVIVSVDDEPMAGCFFFTH